MDQVAPTRLDPEYPRGCHAVSVDGNGRFKLPSRFVECLAKLPSKRMFVTQINGMARMYMYGAWERNLARLKNDPVLVKALKLFADVYGAEVEPDEQNRVTFPPVLRKKLGLENRKVQFRIDDGVALVYIEETLDEQVRQAEAVLAEAAEKLDACEFV
jgi:DNA-binding transcriptional regulator/RsmH inhibitor MraZ